MTTMDRTKHHTSTGSDPRAVRVETADVRIHGTDTITTLDHQSHESDSSQPDALTTLVAEAATGSEDAWRELVQAYGRRVYALAKSRLRNHDVAEDVTQSVFVTVSTKLGGGAYDEFGRFEAWLFRIAINRIRDEIRHQRRRTAAVGTPSNQVVVDDVSVDATPMSGAQHLSSQAQPFPQEHRDDLDRLRAAMNLLSQPDRDIIELRHHGSMTFQHMADLLEEPVGTLLARHHRALRKLRALLEETPPSTTTGTEHSEPVRQNTIRQDRLRQDMP